MYLFGFNVSILRNDQFLIRISLFVCKYSRIFFFPWNQFHEFFKIFFFYLNRKKKTWLLGQVEASDPDAIDHEFLSVNFIFCEINIINHKWKYKKFYVIQNFSWYFSVKSLKVSWFMDVNLTYYRPPMTLAFILIKTIPIFMLKRRRGHVEVLSTVKINFIPVDNYKKGMYGQVGHGMICEI